MGDCALITPVYLEIALFSGARSGTQATGQIIGVIGIVDISIRALREEGDPRPAPRATTRVYFYPRPPRGGRRNLHLRQRNGRHISIHALREEGDVWLRPSHTAVGYFYPRPPRGGRPALGAFFVFVWTFLSTPSARRATLTKSRKSWNWLFLSTPSARRATTGYINGPFPNLISIHALREEGDLGIMLIDMMGRNFYPRPPRGGRLIVRFSFHSFIPFLSTPSARRATFLPLVLISSSSYFYPRPPRGGRPHSFCAQNVVVPISIHALREEGDTFTRRVWTGAVYFYPRPPRGGRQKSFSKPAATAKFLSTPSARRATFRRMMMLRDHDISIHALREEGDIFAAHLVQAVKISIHALREEGDGRNVRNVPF